MALPSPVHSATASPHGLDATGNSCGDVHATGLTWLDGSEVPVALPRHRVSATVRSRSLAILLLLLVLLAYLAPRLYALDRLVTVDEGYWLG